MEMEIEVDVHTVHPSVDPLRKTPLTRKPYGSWCTPEETPAHQPVKQSYSNIETYMQNQKSWVTKARSTINRLQRMRVFGSNPPPDKISIDAIDDVTELKDFKKPKTRRYSFDRSIPAHKKSPPVVETPQSPVPTSPSKDKKRKRVFKLPAFCNPIEPIDPQGRIYITWLFLVTFCYSYNAWCVALRATFPYQTPANTPIWMTIDYLCDIVYLLDLVLIKPRLMYLHEGFWVDDPRETKKNYMKKLQFKFDAISLLPLDILYIYYGTKKVILRFPRLLKLQTFWEFHQAMDRVLATPYVVRIGKTLFYIFYLIHLNACAYYAMSDFIGLGSNGWVYDNSTGGNAYIRCFYFATKTATSIGKNPKPENTTEYLYMTAAWLMGVFVFALLIGQIRDIIATATRAKTEYRKTADGCARYLRRLNMPAALQRRVALWFAYTWRQQRCFDESKILDSLPSNMKRDVALAVHMSTLSKVQLFRDCSESLLRDLVLQLRPVACVPGDAVVRRGEVGHQMYIVKSGECCVMSENEQEVVATLGEGSVFGEISLLGIEGLRRRTATVRARGYTSLFSLTRSALEAALKHHKEAALVLRLRADRIIRENAERQARERMQQEDGERAAGGGGGGGGGLRQRRASSASGRASEGGEDRGQGSASGLTKRRLSVVSEKNTIRYGSVASTRTVIPNVPTIVFSTD